MITNKWEDFGDLCPYHLVAVTAGKYKERYIFTVGGLNYDEYFKGSNQMMTKILMLDTESRDPMWFQIDV